MADSTVTPAVESTPSSAAAPKPGSPEYAAQMASLAPANVPDKFKNQDGSVNLPALVEAYKQAENKISGKPAPAPVAVAKADDKPVNLDAAFTAPVTAPTDTWKAAQSELATDGKISQATRDALKKAHNATDEMIDGMAAGFAANRENLGRRLAESVGGADALNQTIAWARTKMAPEALRQLRADLEGPNGGLVLRGLKATMDAESPTVQAVTKPTEPRSILDLEPTPTNDAVTPFQTKAEYLAAFRDPRFKTDPKFAEWAGRKALATSQARKR